MSRQVKWSVTPVTELSERYHPDGHKLLAAGWFCGRYESGNIGWWPRRPRNAGERRVCYSLQAAADVAREHGHIS